MTPGPPKRTPPTVPELDLGDGADAGHADIGHADTGHAGQRIDEGKGRVFPCEGCGADLRFHIGAQSLVCPYCGHVKEIDISEDAAVEEHDFSATLAHARELREKRRARDESSESGVAAQEVTCDSCGATVMFIGSLVSSECAFCGQPVQVDAAKQVEEILPVDGVLPFQVKREKAREYLRKWVKSRWFAPNEFKRAGVGGKFGGVYLPFWTYDSLTFSHYVGQRGEHYYVSTGSGKHKSTQRRTRWYPASGSFQRFFDDVLVVGTASLSTKLLRKLEPWPLRLCQPYDQRLIAGFLARKYDVELEQGFREAKVLIDEAIRAEVRRRIGGDTQRIHSVNSRYDAITFKHLLLPVWSLGYRYQQKTYQMVINAVTGEVQGTRPWSAWKITLAALGGLGIAGLGALLASR